LHKDSLRLQTMTAFNKKLLQGVQMLHGTVFSKRVPLAAGGGIYILKLTLFSIILNSAGMLLPTSPSYSILTVLSFASSSSAG
jgi:hypothetical protein